MLPSSQEKGTALSSTVHRVVHRLLVCTLNQIHSRDWVVQNHEAGLISKFVVSRLDFVKKTILLSLLIDSLKVVTNIYENLLVIGNMNHVIVTAQRSLKTPATEKSPDKPFFLMTNDSACIIRFGRVVLPRTTEYMKINFRFFSSLLIIWQIVGSSVTHQNYNITHASNHIFQTLVYRLESHEIEIYRFTSHFKLAPGDGKAALS